jgi:hypothetical protein
MSKVGRILLRAGVTPESPFQVRDLARTRLERCHYIDLAVVGRVLVQDRFHSG